MSDAFDTHQDRVADYRERLKYVDGATGMAVRRVDAGQRYTALRKRLELTEAAGRLLCRRS